MLASLLAAGCSIDRIEWESTGFVVEGVTRELEEEHHLEHPIVECIKREVGGALVGVPRTRRRGRVHVQGRGRAARGRSTRSSASARSRRRTSRPGRSRRRTWRTSPPRTDVAGFGACRAGLWSAHGGTRRGQRPSRSFARPDARRRGSGRGPADGKPPSRHDYHHPAAGWGAARSVARVLWRAREPIEAPRSVLKMNHEDGGFDCPGCAWPDDRDGLHLDICENGIKHVTWELTRKKADARVLRRAHRHASSRAGATSRSRTVGRLDRAAASTTPRPTSTSRSRGRTRSRSSAPRCAASTSPNQASFYTSGRLGNEATFLYQLWVREFGTNNLPDCSNMCHEASGRALTASLGTGKGTVRPRRLGGSRR